MKLDDVRVAAAAHALLVDAARKVTAAGWRPGTLWGEMQGAQRGSRRVPVHGGSGRPGVYNAIESVPVAGGVREVTAGTSYLQLVTYRDDGPHARALLAYSQSADPDSSHAADQTERFMRQERVTLPFEEAQIRADPQLEHRRLAERD